MVVALIQATTELWEYAVDGLPMAPNTMKGIITDSIAWN